MIFVLAGLAFGWGLVAFADSAFGWVLAAETDYSPLAQLGVAAVVFALLVRFGAEVIRKERERGDRLEGALLDKAYPTLQEAASAIREVITELRSLRGERDAAVARIRILEEERR